MPIYIYIPFSDQSFIIGRTKMASSVSRKAALHLVLVSLASVLVHIGSCGAVVPKWIRETHADPKVNLTLYYETLCPFSGDFITQELAEAVGTPDIDRVINLRFVPWGNAVLLNTSTTTIKCQHGEDECYLNTIHACAINSWPDHKTHFAFINCTQTEVSTGGDSGSNETVWRTCCEKLQLDPSLISECYSSGLGTKLELQYGEETRQLIPPLKFVPWVVVNGHAIKDDLINFMHYICQQYKGPAPPKSCNNSTLQLTGRRSPTC